MKHIQQHGIDFAGMVSCQHYRWETDTASMFIVIKTSLVTPKSTTAW